MGNGSTNSEARGATPVPAAAVGEELGQACAAEAGGGAGPGQWPKGRNSALQQAERCGRRRTPLQQQRLHVRSVQAIQRAVLGQIIRAIAQTLIAARPPPHCFMTRHTCMALHAQLCPRSSPGALRPTHRTSTPLLSKVHCRSTTSLYSMGSTTCRAGRAGVGEDAQGKGRDPAWLHGYPLLAGDSTQ